MKKLYTILLLSWLILSGWSASAQTPSWLWAESAGGTGAEMGRAIVTDANGNVFVAGYFDSPSITFGTTVLTNTTFYSIFIVKYDDSGNVLWAKSAGGNSSVLGISTDGSGNVLVTGSFGSSSITFGTTTLTNPTSPATDIFIAKYDASGNVLWAKSAGGTSSDLGFGVSTDTGGNVFVTGYFMGNSATFGTTVITNSNVFTYNFFIVKYDASGNVLWVNSAEAIGSNQGNGISTDAGGNVLVTGYFYGDTITFGTTVLNSTGMRDFFIVKYDTSGNVLWAKLEGGTSDDDGIGITTDASGNALVTGYFESPSITFGTTVLTNTGTSAGDIYIVKYDSSGNVLWAKSAGGNSADNGVAVSVDAGGNVLLTGHFESPSLTFGTIALTNSGSGTPDIFIVKYDASGNVLWAKSAAGNSADYSADISTDASGNVWINGYFYSPSITFGTTVLTNAGAGETDYFIAKLDNLTGTEELSSSLNAINIYPNPGNGQIMINSQNVMSEIRILNPQGQIIHQFSPNEKNASLLIDDTGMYYIQITSGKRTIIKKLVVFD